MSEFAQYQGTGKRKTSVARVILRPGDGTTWFNGRTIEEYFPRATHRDVAMAPLKVAGVEGTQDHAGYGRLPLARALILSDCAQALTSSSFGAWASCGCSGPA